MNIAASVFRHYDEHVRPRVRVLGEPDPEWRMRAFTPLGFPRSMTPDGDERLQANIAILDVTMSGSLQ